MNLVIFHIILDFLLLGFLLPDLQLILELHLLVLSPLDEPPLSKRRHRIFDAGKHDFLSSLISFTTAVNRSV